MKLNPECIRNILIFVEDYSDLHAHAEYPVNPVKDPNFNLFDDFSIGELAYHIRQCELSNLIYGVHFYGNYELITIKDLTPDGHTFLANIRQNENWSKTKEIAGKAGSFGLDILKAISEGVATAYVQQHLNLL